MAAQMFGEPVMKNKRDYLSVEEVNDMLDVALEYYPVEYYLLLRVLARTGRRITEIIGKKPFTRKVGLRPIDFHADNLVEWDILKKNYVKKEVKGKERTELQIKDALFKKMPKRSLKYMDSETYELLKAYIEANNILPYKRIFPYRSWSVNRMLKRIAYDAGIAKWRDIHAHMFRHTFAISFLKANENNSRALRLLQQILDHEDLDMTMEYLQFLPDEQQDTMESMYQ